MWSNCFCFVLVTSSQIASLSKLFGNFFFLGKKILEWAVLGKFKQECGGGLRIYFCETLPRISQFFTLPLEIPQN